MSAKTKCAVCAVGFFSLNIKFQSRFFALLTTVLYMTRFNALYIVLGVCYFTLIKTTYFDISLICLVIGNDFSLVLEGKLILFGRISSKFET